MVQIDIPHNLVEKLEIVKGDDITYPLYLTIDISQKKLVRGAYTIDNEEEVFIDKPVSEKNVEKELVKRLKELEILREQVKELEDLKHKKVSLEKKVNNLEKDNLEKDEENERLEGFYEWLKSEFYIVDENLATREKARIKPNPH
ncbi:37897_t:CDS:2 [Gigaspora margarita]|uniref:37897_t:CDS:1 n=1 Tax=Gigaspora margarita TaxID=4874 RepID=A0ABN7UKS5_GIGMA|nr:37897_t:CDS:2 [Gigaspora margarita]